MEIRLLAASALKNDMLVFRSSTVRRAPEEEWTQNSTYEQEHLFSPFLI
jgi:hypothetical protein